MRTGSIARKLLVRSHLRRDARRYPIKRDEYGRSARKRAFEAFNEGKRPLEIYGDLGVSLLTTRRYYADWKKLPKGFAVHYAFMKKAFGKPDVRRRFLDQIADLLRLPLPTLEGYFAQPWGIHKAVRGELAKDPKSRKAFRIYYRWTVLIHLKEQLEERDPPVDETVPVLIDLLADLAKKQRRKRNKGDDSR